MVILTRINGAVEFVTVLIIFILVLALTYFTTRFIGGYQKNKLSGSNIKVIDSMRISNNKLIEIVLIGDKCFAIALCKDTVTFLCELDRNSLDIKSEPSSGNESFDALLNKFKQKINKEHDEKQEDR